MGIFQPPKSAADFAAHAPHGVESFLTRNYLRPARTHMEELDSSLQKVHQVEVSLLTTRAFYSAV